MDNKAKDTNNKGGVSPSSRPKINFGNSVLVMPRAAAERFASATKKDIMALMYCLAESSGWSRDDAAAAFGTAAEDDPAAALAFWRGVGIFSSADEQTAYKLDKRDKKSDAGGSVGDAGTKKLKRPAATLPVYTTDELSDIIERRAGASEIIDECERMLGKMFTTSETAKVMGLMDYLGLDGEYIINLCAHCARVGRRSLRYVETVAFDLYDRGITDPESLDGYLRTAEEASKTEGKIRTMFGINRDRALTARERGFIDAWVGKFGYGMDVIGKAYEITADATGKASLPYANAILEAWNAAGLKNADDVDAYMTAKKGEAGQKSVPEGASFNTDDFFEAALRRSYGDGAEAPDIPSGKGKK